MTRPTADPVVEVQLQSHGRVSGAAMEHAVQKIRAVCLLISVPVLSARVRLTQSADPGVERPAMAQASLDLNGRLLRAHAFAPTMGEAVDALNDRLRDQLERLSLDWESMRGTGGVAAGGKARHGAATHRRPPAVPRPGVQREVVEHKSYSLPRITTDDAADDMEMLGDDFHLFTDLATGQDSVLSRDASNGYRLAQLHPRRDLSAASDLRLSCSELPAPRLTVQEATEQLDVSGLPFVFFENSATGRGNLLYHRLDGDYGLITPAG